MQCVCVGLCCGLILVLGVLRGAAHRRIGIPTKPEFTYYIGQDVEGTLKVPTVGLY